MRGLLFAFQTQKEMDAYAKTDQLLHESFNSPAIRFDGEALNKLEPALKPGLAGGWLYEHDGHLRPDKLMSSWRQLLEREGVQIREQLPVCRLVTQADQMVAVELTDGSQVSADAAVIATGAWTPLLAIELGCRIPIQPGKGYSITMPRPSKCPTIPMIFPEHRVAVTPMQTGYRLGSTMEFAGYDATLNPKRLQLLRDGASHYLQEPFGEPVQEEWFGWRPMTYDSIPIIDRSPKLKNVVIAAGHSMLGLSMATGTGKLVAELLNDEKPHIDPAPYSVRRFG
jgi:D-amino-acid dehydrogenase